MSICLFYSGVYSLTQALAQLNIHLNQITEKGVYHLADALQANKVRKKLFLCLSRIGVYFFIQALTELNLSLNGVGDQCGQYLANALQNNTVSEIISSHVFYWCLLCKTDTHSTNSQLRSSHL